MANHGYVTSRRNFNKDQVLSDLHEINQRRFGGLLTIENDPTTSELFILFDNYQAFSMWISSNKTLEFRHQLGWGFYVEMIFRNELAAKYDGLISDEYDGRKEKQKADPNKYPTYRTWVEATKAHMKGHPMYNQLIELELSLAPNKKFYDY